MYNLKSKEMFYYLKDRNGKKKKNQNVKDIVKKGIVMCNVSNKNYMICIILQCSIILSGRTFQKKYVRSRVVKSCSIAVQNRPIDV
jgi:hypothetical protein